MHLAVKYSMYYTTGTIAQMYLQYTIYFLNVVYMLCICNMVCLEKRDLPSAATCMSQESITQFRKDCDINAHLVVTSETMLSTIERESLIHLALFLKLDNIHFAQYSNCIERSFTIGFCAVLKRSTTKSRTKLRIRQFSSLYKQIIEFLLKYLQMKTEKNVVRKSDHQHQCEKFNIYTNEAKTPRWGFMAQSLKNGGRECCLICLS